MQRWNQGHSRFSADLDRGLGHVIDRLSGRKGGRKAIRKPYGVQVHSGASLSPAARASLRGLAASVLTVTLWVVVLALATPAPGLAASLGAPVANAECIARPLLA